MNFSTKPCRNSAGFHTPDIFMSRKRHILSAKRWLHMELVFRNTAAAITQCYTTHWVVLHLPANTSPFDFLLRSKCQCSLWLILVGGRSVFVTFLQAFSFPNKNRCCLHKPSGQIIIFQQPRYPWNSQGFPFPNATFWGPRSCEVAIVWPEPSKMG